MNKKEDKNYYEDKRDELIEKLKSAVDECLSIIGESIDEEISDDKLHNVLKGKKMASDQVDEYLQKIKKYEDEKNGVNEEEEKRNVKNYAEAMAK